jgi:hypothetical protein
VEVEVVVAVAVAVGDRHHKRKERRGRERILKEERLIEQEGTKNERICSACK